MGHAYITLWSQPQIEVQRRAAHGGDLRHTAGGQFRRVGVEPGDTVYIVAVRNGALLLLAKLDVERVVDQAEAERALGHTDVYEASDHLLGTGTALSLKRVVPEDIVRSIERESGKRIGVHPERYVVSHHGLRATGRITDESAELLDTVLDS